MQCPKCKFENPKTAVECQRCGIIFTKIKLPRPRRMPGEIPAAPKKKRNVMVMIFAGIGVLVVGLFLFGASLALVDRVVNPDRKQTASKSTDRRVSANDAIQSKLGCLKTVISATIF